MPKANPELIMLDALECGKKLWNIKAPLGARIKKMREARNAIEREHAELLERPGHEVQTGILLGAMNLIDGLLE
jgi:hypothetical protein